MTSWLTEALPLLIVLVFVGEVGLMAALLYVCGQVLKAIRELEGRVNVLIRPRVDP